MARNVSLPAPSRGRRRLPAAAVALVLAVPAAGAQEATAPEPTTPEPPAGEPAAAAPAPDLRVDRPAEAWRELVQAAPTGIAVPVADLTLRRDAFDLRFASGSFHLLPEVGGRAVAAVFVGRGSWRLQPATRQERRHLALRAGDPGLHLLEDGFETAVLWFADGTAAELAAAGEPAPAAVPPPATAALERWRGSPGSWIPRGLELRVLASLLNTHPRAGGAFYAGVDGDRLGASLIAVDPAGVLDDEESALVVAGDDGGWWYSSHLLGEVESGAAAGCGLHPLVDAAHYAVDTTIARGTSVEATADVRFEVLAEGLRVLPVALAPSLQVRSAALVTEAGELPLSHVQMVAEEGPASWSTGVLFPEPLARGAEAVVRLRYAGDGVLRDEGVGVYSVGARTSWYPKLGGFQDRATYDLTFRAPEGSQLVAVGRPVESEEAGGVVVSRWRADHPVAVAGFNYGDFARYERHEENTGTDIEVWASTGLPDFIEEINMELEAQSSLSLRQAQEVAGNDGLVYVGSTGPTDIGVSADALGESALADGINTVQVLTGYFGPLPYDRLALTQQVEWSFGQAWPTLVYLPYLSALGSMLATEMGIPGYAGFAAEVGYHEIAHQWWGHRVGWESYRDQWLSEGFAEFSTALMREVIGGAEAYDDFWEARRRNILERPPGSSLAPWEAGAISDGYRASVPAAPAAYAGLTYSKGAYVLHMLRMAMRNPADDPPDARFFRMLREFATAHDGRAATTVDFRRTVEKHIVPELDFQRDGSVGWFFDQWVHGTEIPRYEVDLAADRAGGKRWRIHGTVAQADVSEEFVALVPLYVDLGKGRLGMVARLPFKGEMEHSVDFELELPKKPKRVIVNALHDVLARD